MAGADRGSGKKEGPHLAALLFFRCHRQPDVFRGMTNVPSTTKFTSIWVNTASCFVGGNLCCCFVSVANLMCASLTTQPALARHLHSPTVNTLPILISGPSLHLVSVLRARTCTSFLNRCDDAGSCACTSRRFHQTGLIREVQHIRARCGIDDQDHRDFFLSE